jgi:hypothetical protein
MSFINDLRRQCAQLLEDADELESRRWSMGSLVGGLRVDESDESARAKRSLAARLRQIIAASKDA